ncbi:MAG TPA: hypothetical protein ENF47_05885 [Thermoprotei archaeon]|nr:hypothetical protein [Thermoprotei archaeon]
MNAKVMFLIALILTAFLYPVVSNVVYNVVLPSVNVNAFLNVVGGVSPCGDDGDPMPGEWYPT